ncbi:MAG TPA: hypothetical protein VFC19_17875 [Candidatus Limnocylindrales bacterium]|nr:hypothetical protein [Candidatus Limnocylindrales bacterium]
MKGKRGTAFVVPLVVVASTLVASASPAHAAVEVPAVAIWTMVGTPDGNRIFVSAVERGLIAVDADDTVTQVPGIGRSIGIRIGEDGRTLWVGLPYDRQIAAVDSVTLAVTARYPVGADICPGDVVQTGRYVVFGYSCFSYSEETLPPTPNGIGVLDTQTGAIQRDDGPWRPIMSTSPALPGRVLWAQCCMHEVNLQLLDVTGGTPQHLGARKLGMMNPDGIAVSPDGSQVAVTGVGGRGIETFTTTPDLTPVLNYETTCATRSVAWSADGQQVATMCNGLDYMVAVFARGNPQPIKTSSVAGAPERVPTLSGLVLAGDASRATIGTYALWDSRRFIDRVGLRPSSASVSGPSTGYATRPTTFTARLLLGSAPAPAGTTLFAYREDSVNSTLIGTYVTDASGSISFTDAAPWSAAWTYRVHFQGNDDFIRTDGRFTLQVERLPTSLSIAYQPGKTRRGTNYGSIVVNLGSTSVSHRVVTVTATTASGTQTVTREPVPDTGPLIIAYPISTPTTFTVTYEGTNVQAPATATVTTSP